MARFVVWQATDSILKRIPSNEIQPEQHSEDWIEADPQFVQSELEIVGRQVGVEGGRIDVFQLPGSEQVLVRESTEPDTEPISESKATEIIGEGGNMFSWWIC